MDELNEHAILYNTAALTSLKRAQLVSLSKRYGLKANGKNTEIVQRLQDFGQSLTPCAKGAFDAAMAQDSESPTKHLQADDDEGEPLAPLPQTSIKTLPSTRTIGRASEAWEVITTGDSSLVEDGEQVEVVEEKKVQEPEVDPNSVSTRSWKSADNGAPLDDFGVHKHQELRGVGSLRSLASSIRRTASRTLQSRHKDTLVSQPNTGSEQQADDDAPPSPASTIGVTKRHPEALHHRPSTIRLVSPSAAETFAAIQRAASPEYDEELPLMGQNTVDLIRQRTSKPPLRGSVPPVALHNQRSIPVLSPAPGRTGIYPSLPTLSVTHSGAEVLRSPSPEMPGSFPGSPRSPHFVFGTDHQVSNAEFSDVGAKLLEEMQAKLQGTGSAFNTELLKGKNAELTKLVNVNADLGTGSGGWGLSAGPTAKDRYANSHQREFSRMSSLQSSADLTQAVRSGTASKRKHDTGASMSTTVNGLPVPASEEEPSERGGKRAKTAAPVPRTRYFSSLRKSVKSPAKQASGSTAPSLMSSMRGTQATSRFGFLRHKRTESKSSPDSITSDGEYVLPAASVSVDGQKKRSTGAQSMRASTLHQPTAASISKSTSAAAPSAQHRAPIPDFNPSKPTYQPLKDHSAEPSGSSSSKASKSSHASERSVQRPLSTASSMSTISRSTGKRDLSRIASTEFKGSMRESPSGLPVPTSSLPKSSSRVSLRRSSAASRPSTLSSRPSTLSMSGSAQLGSITSSRPSTMSRSGSTLLAPTAASRARMQATIKPPEAASPAPARRPLPQPPKTDLPKMQMSGIHAFSPFGEASSRANHLFESNFHLEPLNSPFASPRKSIASPKKSILSPSKRPLPHAPAAARRARASGIASVKSTTHHDNADVARRRAEMRSKHERLTQERELRRMLE